MGTFLPISRRVFNISPRYFRWSPKIGFSAVDFEGFLKIRKFFKISKIFGKIFRKIGPRVKNFKKIFRSNFVSHIQK